MPTSVDPGHARIVRRLMAASFMIGATMGTTYAAPDINPTSALGAPQSDANPQPHSNSLGASISDTAITAKVKLKFVNQQQLTGSDIKVTTTNGVVSLSGSAPNSETATAAKQLASTVDGVKSVDSQIQTPGVMDRLANKVDHMTGTAKQASSDTFITSKVETELLSSTDMKGSYLSVTTNNGVVQLSGQVRDEGQKDSAEHLAQQVEGVKSVDMSKVMIASR
jgi:hyperosmotically inducible protein